MHKFVNSVPPSQTAILLHNIPCTQKLLVYTDWATKQAESVILIEV